MKITADCFRSNLPAYLRKTVQVDVMNAEANAYSEFLNAIVQSCASRSG